MNLTALMRLACWMSAIAALAGTVPMAAVASTSIPSSARVAVKAFPLIFGTVPVPAKGYDAPVTKKLSPVPYTDNAIPLSAASKTSSDPIAEKKISATRHSSVPMIKKASFVPVAAITPPSTYLLSEGESKVYRFARPIKRVAVGNPDVADYIIINPSELYLLGKKPGATNLVVWDQNSNSTSAPLNVSRNTKPIEVLLKLALPHETDIHIYSLGQALVLEGSVSDALAAITAYRLVKAYLGGTGPDVNPETTLIGSDSKPFSGIISQSNRIAVDSDSSADSNSEKTGGSNATSPAEAESKRGVVNLLTVRDSQQVRLEVCIAQVSRKFLETLGVSFLKTTGDVQGGTLLTGLVSSATLNNIFQLLGDGKGGQVTADSKPSLFRVLAEPTLVTMSGREGQFLVGGKIFIPIGVSVLTGETRYESQLYGVGLRFMPTVLDAGRMSLKVVAEVSEPEKEAVTLGTKESWPAFKLSTVSTSVQMNEGENLVIGGLKLDNFTHSIDSVPLLGELPILGALFRDAKKNGEKTDLMVIVRPTRIKASTIMPELPTDKAIPPTRGEFFLDGKLEGSRKK